MMARKLLRSELPQGVHVVNVNVPTHATSKTPFRITCASTQSYFHDIVNKGRFEGYDVKVDVETLEPDSDIKGYDALLTLLEEMGVSGICTWSSGVSGKISRASLSKVITLKWTDSRA